jgi:two-component system chemotaxis response regulator CheB/chemosensory pili system protein ChpB (putative protein-glutamate methylesterase)
MSERLDNTFAAEAPAGSGGPAVALPRTALLYADEALLAHVEQALAALRVPVVYRAAIEQADHAALTGSNPEIALINLDDRCSDKLDDVTAALDAAGVPIVFNDADISHGLEGWARARWARHLCAKLCGKDDVDPPRPAQAAAAAAIATPAVAMAETQVVAAVEPAAPVANIAEPPPLADEPASASRPLSQNEIDALVADFPAAAVAAGADTEAWSAQIDALLADAPDSASHEPAPWEVVGFADEEAPAQSAPAPAPASASATKTQPPVAASAPAAPVAAAHLPGSDQWQLVDDFTPVAPAAKPAAPELSTSFGSGLALELEPLDPTESSQ